MREANFTVSSMHGEMVQKERDAIMAEFRGGQRSAIAFSMFGPQLTGSQSCLDHD